MIGYSSITIKGQITIPVDIRNFFGLKQGQKMLIQKEADGIKIKPATDFFSLEGSVKPKTKPENFKKMRKQFIKYLTTRKQSA